MTQKIKPSDYKMLRWSIDFIQHNPGLTTDRLPDELIKFWALPDFTTNPQYAPDTVQLLVFMYVLRLSECEPNEASLALNSYRFNKLFFNFQIILAATAYSRKNNIKITPFPIFRVDKYSAPDLSDGDELIKQYESIMK